MKAQLLEKFKEIYGDNGGICAYFAPGRVNLIGEHTDYNGGHVFPCALTLGTYGIARKREDKRLRFFSLNFENLGVIESDLNDLTPYKEAGWTNYPKGVMWAFEERGYKLSCGLDVLSHYAWVDADDFLVTSEQLVPTGEICSVDGTPMDFRVKKIIGRDIEKPYGPLILGKGYDHNWCLNNDGRFSKVAELSSDISGISMEVYTDLPGMQIYTGNFLEQELGKLGVVYKKRQGVCFETQYYPDSIHHPNFPSPICKKGEQYKTTTTYKFITER